MSQADLLRFVYDVLRRWWKTVLPIGLISAAVAAAVMYVTFERQYEAKTLLWIDQEEPYLVRPGSSRDRNFVSDQLGLIRSSLVLAPIASQPDIATLPEMARWSSPADTLQRMLSVEQAFGTEHFYIVCKYRDPDIAARIANAVTDRYLLMAESHRSFRSNQLIDLLETERVASEREVEVIRDNVRQMTIDQTGEDPFAVTADSERQSSGAGLESQLIAARVQQFVLKAQILALQESFDQNPIEVSDEMVEQHLKKQGHSAVRLDRRRGAERDLRQIESNRRNERIKSLEDELVSNRIREQVLQKTYDAQLAQAKEVSGETLQLEVKRQQLERANQVLDQIADRAFLLRTEQRAPARVELVERAAVPNQPVELGPQKRMAAAGSIALVLPFLLACAWEFRVQRVGNSEQLEKQAELSVIGEIASFPRRRAVPSMSHQPRQELRLFEESIDSLRSLLLLTDRLAKTQVLSVTSAISGEGKTTISTQLAFSIARATGEPTLLIDGDVRSPHVHTVFGISNERGLVELLGDPNSLGDVIDTDLYADLHVMTAGRLRKNPHQLLRIDSLAAILQAARKKYRYIVMDSSPVLAAGEALTIGKAADATILCAMRDFSRHALVLRARRRLVAAGANVVGCVVSGVSPKQYAYRYGSYKYNGEEAGSAERAIT